MTLVTALSTEPNLARLTPKQRRTLARLDRTPWRWFISDDRYFGLIDKYNGEADDRERAEQEAQAQAVIDDQHAYFATISRVTAYTGPDYRVRLEGQSTWIRANESQYVHAGKNGTPRTIWEVPADTAPTAYTVPATRIGVAEVEVTAA